MGKSRGRKAAPRKRVISVAPMIAGAVRRALATIVLGFSHEVVRRQPVYRSRKRHTPRPAFKCPAKPGPFKQFPEFLALEARNIASGKWAA